MDLLPQRILQVIQGMQQPLQQQPGAPAAPLVRPITPDRPLEEDEKL